MLLLRLVLGLSLAAHGAQKLFGWFGGGGLQGTADFFEAVGFAPGLPLAVVGGLAELVGGLFIAFGLLTPLGGAAVLATMIGATDVVRAGSGTFFAANGGFELELIITVAIATVILAGPGRLALDCRNFAKPRWRWLGLGLGVVGGLAAIVVRSL